MSSLFSFVLHMGDSALVLGQRNAEWTGHGPVLEQDIAITNISLDLIGQARNFYQYAAEIYNAMDESGRQEVDRLLPLPWKDFNRGLEEDDLAFLRGEQQFLNHQITELPKGDWAFSILRQFFFSTWQYYMFGELAKHNDGRLAAIAEKSIKETAYHMRWSGEWVIRLGDGTAESNRRINAALEELWMFTGEMFEAADFDKSVMGDALTQVKAAWQQKTEAVFSEAGLTLPVQTWYQSGGKRGVHTEHMGYLLAEMQYLQRTYPNSTW